MANLYLGIDCGISGFLAIVDDNKKVVTTLPMPIIKVNKKNKVDPFGVVKFLDQYPITKATIERQQAMPGQGVSSMFSLGYGFGILYGVLIAKNIPTVITSPKTWQKALNLSALSVDTKTASIKLSSSLYPTVDLRRTLRSKKADHNKSDAILLATYCSTL